MVPQPIPAQLQCSPPLDQQLWYLGRDIHGPFGNALRDYGFVRHRPLAGHGSSSYVLPLPAESDGQPMQLICWGFGVAITRIELPLAGAAPVPWAGIVHERFGWSSRLLRHPLSPSIHQVSDLPAASRPVTAAEHEFTVRAKQLLARAFAGYERWAIATLGQAHRDAALREAPRHKRHRFLKMPGLAVAWEAYGRRADSRGPSLRAADQPSVAA
jgi:hypothetical protein